jgi:hypothetical protein
MLNMYEVVEKVTNHYFMMICKVFCDVGMRHMHCSRS